MKPSEGKQLRQKRTTTAALKREIQSRFGWLDGTPLGAPGAPINLSQGIPWLLYQGNKRFSPRVINITEKEIHDCALASGHLRNSFPRAFPRLVGDVDAWTRRHLEVPKRLRDASKLPDSLEATASLTSAVRESVERITGDCPDLVPLVRALLWRAPHDEPSVRSDLKQLARIAPALNRIAPIITGARPEHALEFQLSVLHLATMLPAETLITLLELIAHPAMASAVNLERSIPFAKFRAHLQLEPSKRGACKPEIGSELQRERILSFIDRLAGMDKSAARFCLRLYLDVCPFERLDELAEWWQRWNELLPFLLNACRRSAAINRVDSDALIRNIEALEASLVHVPEVSGVVTASLKLPQRKAAHRLICAVPSLVEGVCCRSVFLHYLSYHFSSLKVGPVLVEMAAFFRRRPPAKLRDFGPWHDLMPQGSCYYCPEEEIARVLKDGEGLRSYFDAVARILTLTEKSSDNTDFGALAILIATTGDAELATKLCLAAHRADLMCNDEGDEACVIAALKVSTEADGFVKLLKPLLELRGYLDYGHEKAAMAVLRELLTAGEPELQRQLLAEKEFRRIAYLSRLVSCLGGPPPSLPAASGRRRGWMKRYPEELLAQLKALQSFLPAGQGEKRAASILAKNFPDTERLRAELDHIRRKLAEGATDPRLEKRAGKLREWIDSPTELSPARLENLRQKLIRSARQCRLDCWESAIRIKVGDRLRSKLPSFPDLERWVADPELLRHVLGVVELSSAERKHPLRVLRIINAPGSSTPRDFRDQPANQKFLEMLEGKGLNLDPWLKGIGSHVYPLKDGADLELTLEDYPLEILDMGHHFGTCLSPGGCNYFSVYANISDVNKRVVYGRSEGKVKARCLLALCEEGTVLVFNPYSHGLANEFHEIITAFAETLAEAVGTIVTPRGHVPNLVSPDWYDDGPIDIGQRFAFLRDASDFRSALTSIDLENLRDRLFEEITTFDALTVPYVIHLPEFTQRPELILPLIADIRACENQVPATALIRAADLADRAGDTAFAKSVTRHHARSFLLRERDISEQWPALWLLVRFAPSSALEVLRKLRPKGVRSWEQESSYAKLAAAECYHLLHRRKLASRLFKQIDTQLFDKDMKEIVRRRRQELP